MKVAYRREMSDNRDSTTTEIHIGEDTLVVPVRELAGMLMDVLDNNEDLRDEAWFKMFVNRLK